MSRKIRFAVVVSHATPYYTPYYRALVEHGGLDVRAFFCSRAGLDKTLDAGMGVELAWQTDLLSGYDSVILPEASHITELTMWKVNNPSVGRVLAEFAPDIVLLHGYTQRTSMRTLAWCRRNRVPALMISDSSLHIGTPLHMRVAKRAFLPIIFRQFSAFLSIGDANQRYLETFGVARSRIFRVPNMVDQNFWDHRERRSQERARVRSELGLNDKDLMVLYVGKLIGRKRPGDLVAALARLRSMPPTERPISVVFAGDGAQRAELEREVASLGLPARLLGFVNIDTLPGYFCAADLLAHPAEIEAFGVIVLEAAILGLPLVLSHRVGSIGPTSIARPGQNALIYPCRDVDALAHALRRLANEPQTLTQMGAASLRISEELDWRMSVRNTLAAIDYCLGGRRTAQTHVADAQA